MWSGHQNLTGNNYNDLKKISTDLSDEETKLNTYQHNIQFAFTDTVYEQKLDQLTPK